jgi:hypothetical protein
MGANGQRHRVSAGGRLADHPDPLLLEQLLETTPEEVVVIDYERTNQSFADDLS